jgi:F-type H+-transporting ATPase subunit b
MNLIDFPQVLTQALSFVLMVWVLRRYAWGPVVQMLEARREKIAGEFRAAEGARAEAAELRGQYETKLRGVDAEARQRIQEAVVEGQKVAAEIRNQARAEAGRRLERAEDEIAREREKAREVLKEQVIRLSMRGAEKILRARIDDDTQRKLVGEFIDEVGTLG